MAAKWTSKEDNGKESAWHWVPKTPRAYGCIIPTAQGAVVPALKTMGSFLYGNHGVLCTQTGESKFSKTETLKGCSIAHTTWSFRKPEVLFNFSRFVVFLFWFYSVPPPFSLFRVLYYHYYLTQKGFL